MIEVTTQNPHNILIALAAMFAGIGFMVYQIREYMKS